MAYALLGMLFFGTADGGPVAYLGLRTLGLAEAETSALDGSLAAVLAGPRAPSGERCAANLHCYCSAAREQSSARALYGNIARAAGLFTIELLLLDAQTCRVENSVFVSEPHELDSALARIAALARQLLTPPHALSQTAVKDDRELERTPAVVTVITARDIRQLGLTRAEEVFPLVPGFEIIDLNYIGRVVHYGLGETLLILIDGVPLHNALVAFSGFGADIMIPLEHIERVEFVRGPASVVWGTNALLGVVNFVTKAAHSESEQVVGHVRWGTLATREIALAVGARRSSIAYYVAVTAWQTRGSRTHIEDSLWAPVSDANSSWGNSGWTENSADEATEVVAKVTFFDRLSLGFKNYQSKDVYQLTPRGSLLHPGEEGQWDKYNRIYSVRWADALPLNISYELQALRHEALFYERFAFYAANDAFLPLGDYVLQGNGSDPIVNHMAEARVRHGFDLAPLTNRTVAGLSFLHQVTPDIYGKNVRGSDPGAWSIDLESQQLSTLSLFVQDDATFWRLVTLSAGLRYDHHDPFQSILNKQAGVLLDTPWLSAKLLYSEGFRNPTVNSLYSTKGLQGVPTLRPESSWAVTAEVTARAPAYGHVRVGASRVQLKDLIRLNYETPPAGFDAVPENKGTIDVQAAFAELRAQVSSVADTFLSYAFKQVDESMPTNDGIPVAPHTAALGVNVRPLNDVGVFAATTFIGERKVRVLERTGGDARQILPPFLGVDLGFTISNILEYGDLTLRASNVLGVDRFAPLQTTGNVNPIIERRVVQEVLLTLQAKFP